MREERCTREPRSENGSVEEGNGREEENLASLLVPLLPRLFPFSGGFRARGTPSDAPTVTPPVAYG